MSIDLPRSHRGLHFTGSVRALGPERPANALGQERPKGPPPSPGRSVGAPPPPARPVRSAGPVTRAPLVSIDDDLVTQAIDKDQIDAALFPVAKRASSDAPAPNLPVPHFRTAAEAQQHHAQPTVIVQRPKGGLPLGAWLAIAVIAAVVSFNLAPQAAETVTQAVHALDAR